MNLTPATSTNLISRPYQPVLPDRDELLQASRRVDWRFLLPQPDLGDIAYVGASDSVLIDSLRQFGRSLTVLEDRPSVTNQYSLVVASNPNRTELAQAVQTVCAGGFVYVEIDRKRRHRQVRRREPRPLRSIRDSQTVMNDLKLADLQVHWHWPTFESCTEIIPLLDRSAAVCALKRRGSGVRSQWKSRLALLLLRTQLLGSLVPCFSVLGQRFQQEDSDRRRTSDLGQ